MSEIASPVEGSTELTESADANELARAMNARIPFLLVSAGAAESPALPWDWTSLRHRQAAGEDPTATWREALAASTAHQYARPAPRAMPAAFVLQWVLEVPATIGAYAAVLGPWAADLSAGLSFALDPSYLFPSRIQFGRAVPAPADPARRLRAAHAAYDDVVRPFAEHYQPGVKLGRHQRLAMVDDVWAIAVHRATEACPAAPAPAVPQRASCCFIYALPGTNECAGCPRLRRTGADGDGRVSR